MDKHTTDALKTICFGRLFYSTGSQEGKEMSYRDLVWEMQKDV